MSPFLANWFNREKEQPFSLRWAQTHSTCINKALMPRECSSGSHSALMYLYTIY